MKSLGEVREKLGERGAVLSHFPDPNTAHPTKQEVWDSANSLLRCQESSFLELGLKLSFLQVVHPEDWLWAHT